jgi:amidase
MVPVAHASDGGGSIRVPASACGLVGLKPGRARVGHAPDVGEGWAGATVEGVLTRSVRDTAAVLDAVAGPLPGDPHAAPPLPRPLVEEIGAPVAGLRAGLCASPPDERWLDDPACRAAVAAAGRLLEDLGLAVEEAHPAAFFDDSFSRHFNATIAVDTALVLADLERVLGRPITDDELEPRNAYYRSSGSRTSAPDYLGSRAWLGSWSRGVAAFWSDQGFDLLVTPTVGAPPPELGWFTAGGPREEGRRIGSYIPWTAQANVTGQPAISLPLHTTDDGLPVGVQLVAAAGREDLLVRVAAALEEAAPWAGRRPAVWSGRPA